MANSKRTWIKPALLTAALLAAGGLGVAGAKSTDGGHGHCGAHHGKHGGHTSGKSSFMGGRHIDGKLAFLKAELKITEEQDQAWQAFAAVVREARAERAGSWRAHREHRAGGKDEARAAPLDERIDRRLQAMEQHVERFRRVAEAGKSLYAALSTEQQRVADKLLSRGHRRGHGHGGHFGY